MRKMFLFALVFCLFAGNSYGQYGDIRNVGLNVRNGGFGFHTGGLGIRTGGCGIAGANLMQFAAVPQFAQMTTIQQFAAVQEVPQVQAQIILAPRIITRVGGFGFLGLNRARIVPRHILR